MDRSWQKGSNIHCLLAAARLAKFEAEDRDEGDCS
jgi:hypothetical protein